MQKRLKQLIAASTVLGGLAVPQIASAGGFYLQEQSVRGAGRCEFWVDGTLRALGIGLADMLTEQLQGFILQQKAVSERAMKAATPRKTTPSGLIAGFSRG